MSEELFPTRFKKNPHQKYIICKLCNNEMPEVQCTDGICSNCLSKGQDYQCKTFIYNEHIISITLEGNEEFNVDVIEKDTYPIKL